MAIAASACTVGTVADAISGTPLAGATVAFRHMDTSTTEGFLGGSGGVHLQHGERDQRVGGSQHELQRLAGSVRAEEFRRHHGHARLRGLGPGHGNPENFPDVSGLASGTYWLEAEVNPNGTYLEADTSTNIARVRVTL